MGYRAVYTTMTGPLGARPIHGPQTRTLLTLTRWVFSCSRVGLAALTARQS